MAHNSSIPVGDRDEQETKDNAAPKSAGISSAITAMNDARQRIPGDVVNRATAELPDAERSAIRRFHAYYIEHDLSLAEAAAVLKIDHSTLSLVLRGKYTASVTNIAKAMTSFCELEARRAQGKKVPFIETRLAKRIWQVCESALDFQRIGYIFGESQIGKSEALKKYAADHNHGSTIYVSMPTGGHLLYFLSKLATVLRISTQMRRDDLRRRLIEAFDDRMLLIVDEAHQAIPKSDSSASLQTIEFIRELFDEAHCGLVICATNIFRDTMEGQRGHEKFAKILAQTRRRRLCALQLDDRPSQGDLNIFAAAYGLQPSAGEARELEKKIIEEEALGMWLTLLRMSAKLAGERKQTLNWSHVIAASKALEALEGRS